MTTVYQIAISWQWRHNGRDGVSNHWRLGCLLNCSFRLKSTNTAKLRVTGLCAGNSPLTGEFPAKRASNAEIVMASCQTRPIKSQISFNVVFLYNLQNCKMFFVDIMILQIVSNQTFIRVRLWVWSMGRHTETWTDSEAEISTNQKDKGGRVQTNWDERQRNTNAIDGWY